MAASFPNTPFDEELRRHFPIARFEGSANRPLPRLRTVLCPARAAASPSAPAADRCRQNATGFQPETVALERVAPDQILDSHSDHPVIPYLEEDMGVRDGETAS